MKVEEKKIHRIVNRIICSLEGAYAFKGSGKDDYFWCFKGLLKIKPGLLNCSSQPTSTGPCLSACTAPRLSEQHLASGMYQVVAFLAIVMGTHTLSLRHQKDCTHWPNCCSSKVQDPTEEWLKWNTVFMPPPETTSFTHHPESCKASEDGPLNSRSISPWRYELDRDLNRLPQDLYHARCLCPHCVSLQTGSHMDPLGNSELLYHNQTVFYRRPCPGEQGTEGGYCLERRLYRVSLACVCVRPRVMA
ncbi:PREDICTED: interleukin-25 isoform X1 [Hipposideros armiger]|uniref:Interleukin-25 isoform X1 n=2 Tax=Hipposideros armiger TaxID=186990 RepID=A0A8B7SYW4_HIPAR|nr:PREDICTED: interleukin-25 isoform X1 [Hipposideros armiger]